MRLGIVFLSVLSITLAATLQQSYADSITWDGDGGDGLWSTPTNWSGDALPDIGDDVTILDATVTMDTDVSGLNSLTLDGTTILTIQSAFTLDNGGSLVVLSPSEMVNDGNLFSTNMVDVQGKLTNTNSVEIEGTFSLDGIFDNYSGFQNRGLFTITTNGELNNNSPGTFDNDNLGITNNHGTVNNFDFVNNYGEFNNFGTINNTGTLTLISGPFTNSGTINNSGTVFIGCDGLTGNPVTGGTVTLTCPTANNPPIITISNVLPPNAINGTGAEATSPTGTQISFDITAFDTEDNEFKTVTCDYASPSLFNVGITPNMCSASDSQGSIATKLLLMTIIDTIPPQITVPSNISEEAQSPSGNIVNFDDYGGVSATDNGDPSPDVICNPLSGSLFPIGNTTVECTANDMSGNTTPTPTLFFVEIHDNTAPNAPIITGASGLINDNTPTITGTAEAGATVTITLAGPTPTILVVVADSLGNWSIVSTLLSDGAYTATAVAEDISGNTSGTSAPVLFTVDTIPPQTTITSGPSGTVLTNDATFAFTSDSTPSTFKCSLDGTLYSSCTSPIDYLGLSEGTHTFAVNATDQAGNTDSTPASQIWIVDTTTTTPIISGPTGSITDPTPTITGTAEAGATVTITLAGPTPTILVVVADSLGNWSIVSTLLSDGAYTATAVAEDISGHVSGTSAPVTFTLMAPASNVILSGIIRDFKIAHPDFEYKISDDDGIVQNLLHSNKEPTYNGNPATITTTGLVNFNQWYNHVNTINQCTTHDITLTRDTAGIYSFSNNAFFPIDGQLFGNEGKPHNYHFTYQVYAQFVYQAGQTITMTGDDDIWVFIDNKLALDQGGVLPPRTGTINLDTLGLTAGQTYEFALFFAERHTVQSNLGITTNIEFTPITLSDCDAIDAVDDSAIIGTGTTTLDVTNNDSGFTSVFSFTQGSNGSISLVGNSLTYTPNPGFVGTDQFTYTIINANTGNTDTAVVSVVITEGSVNGLFCEQPISAYSRVIIGTNGNNNLVGTHGNDLIIGLDGNDKIIGLKGNDCLIGDTGNDIINGEQGDDYVLGGSGNDKIAGNHNNDKLYGQNGDDKIEGGDGNDYIDGGNHIQGDQCKGGSGTNTILNCEKHNKDDD